MWRGININIDVDAAARLVVSVCTSRSMPVAPHCPGSSSSR